MVPPRGKQKGQAKTCPFLRRRWDGVSPAPRETKRTGKNLSFFEATMGFEPMIRVLQTLALATWPRRHKKFADW